MRSFNYPITNLLNSQMIFSLQSEIGHEHALRKLSPSGPLGMVRRMMTGDLLGVSDIYIPYRLYKVTVDDRRVRSARYLAVDAISGALDPYEFGELPGQERYAEVETHNCLPVRYAEADSRALILEKARRMLFSGGFFRLARPVIAAELIGSEFYVPYWAGFYGQEQNVKVLMLDGIRGTVEGSKVSHLVRAWLLEQRSESLETAGVNS
jgi:hypothetical protein